MVRMIMDLVQNRSFTFNFTTDGSKQSRIRLLKNGVPQGSVSAPLLFNLYICMCICLPQLQVYLGRGFSIAALPWKLEGLRGDFKSRHDHNFSIFPDLEVEAQTH